MGHSKVAAPGRLGTTGRRLAIGNCKDGSLRSVLIWDVGPGLAPARPSRHGGRRPYSRIGTLPNFLTL